MKLEEILIKLKTEKLCPSVKNNAKIKVDKECPEEGNIRCIECSCNFCENDCTECDVEDCEPQVVVHK